MRPQSFVETGYQPRAESLEACDEDGDDANVYCPVRLLGQFSLLMAGQGRCVSTAMMLADREYAMWQLARARATDEPELRAVAGRLFAWFDERQPH